MQLLVRDVTIYDAEVLLEWRNGADVKKASRNQMVISKQEHWDWLAHRLESSQAQPFWFFENEVERIGLVRFDLDSRLDHYEIAITINPKLRGKGFGKKILCLSVEKFFALNSEAALYAEVHKLNVASRQLFLNCGFSEFETEGNFLIFKRIANLN